MDTRLKRDLHELTGSSPARLGKWMKVKRLPHRNSEVDDAQMMEMTLGLDRNGTFPTPLSAQCSCQCEGSPEPPPW
jgi:hypothetical protein